MTHGVLEFALVLTLLLLPGLGQRVCQVHYLCRDSGVDVECWVLGVGS